MKRFAVVVFAALAVAPSLAAQETPKPVPKDSMRVSIPRLPSSGESSNDAEIGPSV